MHVQFKHMNITMATRDEHFASVREHGTAVSLYNSLIRTYGSGLLLSSGHREGPSLPVANNKTIFSHAQQVGKQFTTPQQS